MNRLLARIELIYTKEQQELVKKALDFATEKHKDQKRVSGEPYITHPIAVANILLDLGLDCSAICAALLHDVIEDTDATEKDLRKLFGNQITDIVLGVTKLRHITFKSHEEEQAENFRRMFFAMAKDIRVIFIKLADRLHNMRTITFLAPERQIAMANETLEIYSRLASRLGLSYFKCELEDLCLKVLHPDAYEALVKEVALKRAERKELVDNLCNQLKIILTERHMVGEVSGRNKHFYSIYKKMLDKNKTFDQIYDLTAVRVIVEKVADCYEILGLIHTKWKPIPGRFKDYIAVPKPNNYQSLHTTVMTNYGMPFEIQIRTYDMHRIAEYGIAAHWKYKERIDGDDVGEHLEWLRSIMDEQSDSADPQELYESLKIDLNDGQVFVFTPKGDVTILPVGATPIDFAYSIHSEVGNRCVGAKINSKIVPLETKLETGDYIEIITSNNAKGPSRDWLRVVKTTQAKSKIRAFFKREMKDENIKKGKEMLDLEAKRLGFQLSDLLVPSWLEIVMQRYSISSLDDLCASVGYGGYSVHQIIPKLIDFYKKEQKSKLPVKNQQQSKRSSKDSSGILIKGQSDLLCHLGRCCNPVPGDEIIGYISRGNGITVHRTNCPNVKSIEPRRLIEASWAPKADSSFVVALQIIAKNKNSLISSISTVVSELKLSFNSINAHIDKNDKLIVMLGVCVTNINQIDALLKKMDQIPEVEQVFRSTVV